MAPSKQSGALKEIWRTLTNNFPKDGDPFLTRCVYDHIHTAAAEAKGVTYKSTNCMGVPCLEITPENASGRARAMLYMHGGGFSFGSPNSHRKMVAHLAKACGCVAILPDYRLTPEHPFPAGLDDCLDVYRWMTDEREGWRGREIVVAGDSCGGGLSASLPLAAAQNGLPRPGVAISMSPWYDMNGGYDSYTTNKDVDEISAPEGMEVMADKYTGGKTSRDDPLVSPIKGDFSLLPPTWISVAGDDILRDQGTLFAEKAKEAGLEVVLEVHEGQQHVVEFMAGKAPEADESIRRMGEWVREKLKIGVDVEDESEDDGE